MANGFNSIFAAVLVLLLTAASLPAFELPDAASSGASTSLLYSKPTRGKKAAPGLAIAGTPFSGLRGDPALRRELIERGIRERLIECRLLAERNGSPVKGLRVEIGVDYINSLNQFENIFTQTTKTDRDGIASASARQVPGDPHFAEVSAASFFSAGAFFTNGKRFDSAVIDCTFTEALNGTD